MAASEAPMPEPTLKAGSLATKGRVSQSLLSFISAVHCETEKPPPSGWRWVWLPISCPSVRAVRQDFFTSTGSSTNPSEM